MAAATTGTRYIANPEKHRQQIDVPPPLSKPPRTRTERCRPLSSQRGQGIGTPCRLLEALSPIRGPGSSDQLIPYPTFSSHGLRCRPPAHSHARRQSGALLRAQLPLLFSSSGRICARALRIPPRARPPSLPGRGRRAFSRTDPPSRRKPPGSGSGPRTPPCPPGRAERARRRRRRRNERKAWRCEEFVLLLLVSPHTSSYKRA